jgi:hypothetical protein
MKEFELVVHLDVSPEARSAPSQDTRTLARSLSHAHSAFFFPFCAQALTRAGPLPLSSRAPAARQTLLRLLYDDEGVFYRRYHAVVSKDDTAKVSPWAAPPHDASAPPGEPPALATRSVTFTKRMDIPAAITRLLGARLRVRLRAHTQTHFCAFAADNSHACTCATHVQSHLRPPPAGDVSSLLVEEVQRVRSLGARGGGGGAEITSVPIVQMKARALNTRTVSPRTRMPLIPASFSSAHVRAPLCAVLLCVCARGWTSSRRRW